MNSLLPIQIPKRDLNDWLDYQQRIHPRSVELGLERVGTVWRRMGAPRAAPLVITVGGTNGKGSTVAFIEAMLAADGKRVGCYVSPHLLHYNERVRVLGIDVADALLVDAFERIEDARAAGTPDAIALTYFEFGTLAALWIFAQSKLDVAVLEVGLGGRLDAVNIIDADAAIVTTVDLDHQDWLGDDVDSIGREKAGIFRAGRPAIIGMLEPPQGLLEAAKASGARLSRAGRDFQVSPHGERWQWTCADQTLDLPAPRLAAPCQRDNAAAAIAVIHALRDRLGFNPVALADGVRRARAPARLQRLAGPDGRELVVDVAHNPQAARALAQWLAQNPPRGRNVAVFGALADKDVAGIVSALLPHIRAWFLAGLDGLTPRGLSAQQVDSRLAPAKSADEDAGTQIVAYTDVAQALSNAAGQCVPGDRILAFGSFFVAASALEWARQHDWAEADPT